MMNKKRLAALAMSAVMAAGTVSIPVNAADFSDGAAVQEEVAVQSVDVTEETPDAAGATVTSVVEKEWKNTDTATPTLIVTVTTDAEGETAKDYEVTTGFTKQTVNATCTQEGGYTWTVTYMGKTFVSDFVKTADKADHVYEEVKTIVTHPNCTTNSTGTMKIVEQCKNCGATKGEPRYETIPVSHSWEGEATVTYKTGTNTVLVNGDDTIPPVLGNKGKPGSYTKITSQYCKACKKTITSTEPVDLPAEEIIRGTKIEISEVENIATPDFDKINDINNIPKEEDIVLTDCTKDGSYVITYLDENNDKLDSVDVTVKAHHVMKVTGFDYVNEADEKENYLVPSYESDGKKPILDKDGHIVVVNNTCLKDVEYYEISTCQANGCKETAKEKKIAVKSDKHIVDTGIKDEVVKLKENASNKYDDVLKAIGGEDSKFAKIVNVTATCEKAGTVDVELTCKVCGEKADTVTGIKVDALEHKPTTKAENIKEATCTSTGSYTAVTSCERCGEVISKKDVVIKQLPHTNESKETEVSIGFKGGTVYGDGSYKIGQEFTKSVIGEVGADKENPLPTLTAYVITNCTACHDNEKVLMNDDLTPSKDVTVKIVALTGETYDKYGSVVKAGNITVKATYTTEENETVTAETTVPFFSNTNLKIDDQAKNGLWKDEDGVYRYYINGDFVEDFRGIAEYGDKEFFVVDGVLCQDASGLNLVGDEWYLLTEGRIRTEVTQLVEYDGEWFFVANGKLDTSVNDLVEYDGETFVFVDGRLAQEGNGLWIGEEGVWYFLSNGRVAEEHTGLAMYDDEWFYVVEGKLAVDYSGTVEFEGGTFKVDHGMVKGQVK